MHLPSVSASLILLLLLKRKRNDTKEAPKKKLRGSYVNIRAEVSSIIPSLDTLPLPLCTLAIMHAFHHFI